MMVNGLFERLPMSDALLKIRQQVETAACRKIIPRHAYAGPLSVHWEITNRCNLGCVYCYNSASPDGDSGLPKNRLIEIADQMADLGILEVTLSGGEVLTAPRLFWAIVERLRRASISLRLITNGWYLSDGVARRLEREGFSHILVSLDAPLPDIHDALRGKRDSFTRAVYGLGALSRSGLTSTVICVLNRVNASHIENLVELSDLLSVRRIIFEDLRETGRGAENGRRLRLTDEQYENVFLRLQSLTKRRRNGCQIKLSSDTRFALDLLAIHPPFTCCIRANGEVFPVESVSVSYGNLKDEPLQRVWKRIVEAHQYGAFRVHADGWKNRLTPTLHLARSEKVSHKQ